MTLLQTFSSEQWVNTSKHTVIPSWTQPTKQLTNIIWT